MLAVLALGPVLLAAPALGLHDRIVQLIASDKPPPELIVTYFENNSGTATVLPKKARVAIAVYIPGFGKKVIWVAPTKGGGFCSTASGCDPNRSIPLQPTLQIAGPTSKSPPEPWSRDMHVLFEGDTLVRNARAVVVEFEDGSSQRASIVHVPKPIDAGFFVYELSKEHWDKGKRPVALTVVDARGKELARDTKVVSYFRDAQSKGLAPPTGAKPPMAAGGCQSGEKEATRTFSDPSGDAGSSLDIKSVEVSEYCGGGIAVDMTVSGPPSLLSNGPFVALDLDQNPDTGSAFYGTEVEVALVGPEDEFGSEPIWYRAHGWDFGPATPQYGVVSGNPNAPDKVNFTLESAKLGMRPGQGFNFVVGSEGNHPDTAPDIGTFNYQPGDGKPPPLERDRRAPKVLVFDSMGVHGQGAKLGYWVLDGRGRTRQIIRIFRGNRLLKTIWTPLADANPFDVTDTTWHVPSRVHGRLRFTVRSIDAAGNKSGLGSASLVIR